MTILLAFLAPILVVAAVGARLPQGIRRGPPFDPPVAGRASIRCRARTPNSAASSLWAAGTLEPVLGALDPDRAEYELLHGSQAITNFRP
jgi:hypothetical protein